MDHTADFLKFISSAQSFWFSLDTSYNHGCHLASRFRLDPDEYEALLIVAGLASYTRFGFQIMADAWRKFLGGRWFVIDNCADYNGGSGSGGNENSGGDTATVVSTYNNQLKVEQKKRRHQWQRR